LVDLHIGRKKRMKIVLNYFFGPDCKNGKK